MLVVGQLVVAVAFGSVLGRDQVPDQIYEVAVFHNVDLSVLALLALQPDLDQRLLPSIHLLKPIRKMCFFTSSRSDCYFLASTKLTLVAASMLFGLYSLLSILRFTNSYYFRAS